ncbi:MAG: DNA integrity scanning diadenylate cyclase DisA [Actinobacteria bacterium]|nr:DNA integrity scanning diadenylate cyclase DisA [Actinomycetota bacterium]
MGGQSISETLERLAPGTNMRVGLERIIQQGKGGLVVLGSNQKVVGASSGGFTLNGATFTPARLAELSKMDGGIILDDGWGTILRANVHFIPDGSIPTEETGARHRTAERLAVETGVPVVAVSEGRKLATLFYEGEKIELASATELAAHINQDLLSLDRLRSRLDDAERRLTRFEVAGLATYRFAVTVIQRAEMVDRMGKLVADRTVTLGDEGLLATVQLNDLITGVEHTRRMVLLDYLKPLRAGSVERAIEDLEDLSTPDLEDLWKVAKILDFADLDEPVEPRGHRLLARASRLPDPVRDDIVRHFGSLTRLLSASVDRLTEVEGVGGTRAAQLRAFFERLQTVALDEPILD